MLDERIWSADQGIIAAAVAMLTLALAWWLIEQVKGRRP